MGTYSFSNGVHCIALHSFSELMSLPAHPHATQSAMESCTEPFRDYAKAKWASGQTPAQIKATLAALDYPPGIELMQEIMRDISAPGRGNTRRSVLARADEGDELDVQQVLMGQLGTAWSTRRNILRRAPRIYRILASIGGSAALSPRQIATTGATALALRALLERDGDRVEISILNRSTRIDDVNDYILYCPIKRANDTPNMPLLSIALAYSATFRVSLLAHVAHYVPNCSDYFGYSASTLNYASYAPPNPRAIDIVLPPTHWDIDAREFISDITQKISEGTV